MTMNRADYEAVAATVATSIQRDPLTVTEVSRLAVDLAERFCSGSDSFDPIRFLESCGIDVIWQSYPAEWRANSIRLPNGILLRKASLETRRRNASASR
jgi:hypothetical protein